MSGIQKSYYAIIPADVRYDESITPNAKLLYGEITALCNEKGYCWANNRYFSDLYNVTNSSISKWITQLVKSGYVTTELIYAQGSKEVKERRISIAPIVKISHTPSKNLPEGIVNNSDTPIVKKFKDNTTLINNTFNNTVEKLDPSVQEVFVDFIELRKSLKAKNTDRAINLLINELNKLSNEPEQQIKIIEQSIMNSWKSVYAIKHKTWEKQKGEILNGKIRELNESIERAREEGSEFIV